MRTRSGVLKLSRRDTRRSEVDIFIVVSMHQEKEWHSWEIQGEYKYINRVV